MIYLFGAIGANLCMTFLMRYMEHHNGNRYAMNIWNYLAGFLFSIVLIPDKTLIVPKDIWGAGTVALGAVDGALFVIALITIQKSIARNGPPLTTTFNRMGILIPTVLSALLFGEIPTAVQITGLCLAIFAIIYMNGGRKEEKPAFVLGLILALLFGGTVDMIAKTYSRYFPAEMQSVFVMYTFFFAMLVSIGLFFKVKPKMTWLDVLIGIGVGIPNQLTTRFVLHACLELPAYVVYPTYSAGLILAVNIINYLVFREKLSKRQYTAMAIIGVALICINL